MREHTIGLEEAVRYLGIAPSTLRKRAAGGRVPGYKPGRRWVFMPSEIEQYLRASAPPQRRAVPLAVIRSAVSPAERSGSDLAREIRRTRMGRPQAHGSPAGGGERRPRGRVTGPVSA
jgi:excisionase family DNA binding protein